MTLSLASRRALSLLALGVALAASDPLSAKERTCVAFLAEGTSTFVSADKHRYELTLVGDAEPIGEFAGTVDGKFVGPGDRETGTITLDFGDGNTLTISQDLTVSGVSLAGTYAVKHGTGTLKGASGSGTLVIDLPAADGTREFHMAGTLCQ